MDSVTQNKANSRANKVNAEAGKRKVFQETVKYQPIFGCVCCHSCCCLNCMIARSLIFMKVHQKPKSRMAGVKDKLVNVPVHEDDILDTLNSLPRTPYEAGIIPVKLKKKKEYKNTHKEKFISISKIKIARRTTGAKDFYLVQ